MNAFFRTMMRSGTLGRGAAAVVLTSFATQSFADYNRAMAYFRARDYVSSSSEFFQTMLMPRRPGEKQKSEMGLAQSLHNLGFYYSASKYYSNIVAKGPRPENPFFAPALEELGAINSTINLGQSHIVQLLRKRVESISVPGRAAGFYFYYLGSEAFNKGSYEEAKSFFDRVPSNSVYGLQAAIHLGVIANLMGQHSTAIRYFERAARSAPDNDEGDLIRETANLNIARVMYETKRYRESLSYYNQIQRDSDNWTEALFEAAWAFFMMQKPNNTLGEIHTLHSPFFDQRYFPESYVLEAITYVRLCRYDRAKEAIDMFERKYSPVRADLRDILARYESDAKGFYSLVHKYRNGDLNDHKNSWVILDFVSRTDPYKQAEDVLRFSDRELVRLQNVGGRWGSVGLTNELQNWLDAKRKVAMVDAGKRLYESAKNQNNYLGELVSRIKLIKVELLEGKLDELRSKINVGPAEKKVNFMGGMQALNLSDDIEYWPFEKEYWEDELGHYVYNIDSRCKGAGGK